VIYIVTADNRRQFRPALMEMHQQRKAVFIDQLGWRLQEIGGVEIDDYDSEEAIYLIEAESPQGPVTGSARLLPTTGPHLLGDVFADLCETAPPSGPNVWEATRFCPAPGGTSAQNRQLLVRIIGAILEAGLLFGVERATFVASAALAPLAVKAGWDVSPLGPSHMRGRERVRAFVAEINVAGLKRVRARLGVEGPVSRYAPPLPRLAA
jgi:N-acyl-L-homoserine lactone synthetase